MIKKLLSPIALVLLAISINIAGFAQNNQQTSAINQKTINLDVKKQKRTIQHYV